MDCLDQRQRPHDGVLKMPERNIGQIMKGCDFSNEIDQLGEEWVKKTYIDYI